MQNSESGYVSRVVTLDDIRRYSAKRPDGQRDLLSLVQRARRDAAGNARLGDPAFTQSHGDGQLARWGLGTTAEAVLNGYAVNLKYRLDEVNRPRTAAESVQMRLAVTEDVSELEDGNLAGRAPVVVSRLVNAPQCRIALERAPGCPLVVIITDEVHSRYVASRDGALNAEGFVRVHVADGEKGFKEDAWLTVPGCDVSRLQGLDAEAQGRGRRTPVDDDRRVQDAAVPKWLRRNAPAVGGLMGALLIGGVIALLMLPFGTPSSATDHTGASASGGSGVATSSGAAPSGQHYAETTDNRNGTPVFADAQGAAPAGEAKIPFDTQVQVSCWASNVSGMSSVYAFYVIDGGKWNGDFAPSNTFANGDPIGGSGDTQIDPAVPKCSSEKAGA